MAARLGESQAVRRLHAQFATTRALAESSSLREATPKVLQAICETLGWEHGALWRVDAAAEMLRCVELWSPPRTSFPEFAAVSRRTTFPRGVGLPGRVWASGKPAWIPDVVRDPNFPRAPIAAREGLHAAFGFPVLLGAEVLGVLEFFSREIRRPDQELLALLATVGSQIGQFVERRRAEDELTTLFETSRDMLCVAGFDGYFRRLNPALERTLGFTPEELRARPFMDFVHPDDRKTIGSSIRGERDGSARGEACRLHNPPTTHPQSPGVTPHPLQKAHPHPPRSLVCLGGTHYVPPGAPVKERSAWSDRLGRYRLQLVTPISRPSWSTGTRTTSRTSGGGFSSGGLSPR